MKVKELIASRIEAAFDQVGLTGPAIVQTTSSPKLGDFQVNGVMAAAKKAKLDPSEKAREVIEAVKLEDIALEVSFAKPGFINIKLAPDFLKHLAPDKITQDDQALNIVVDYSAPNLAKEMHVGHLRSTIIGDSMANILESKGHNVIRQNHVGDWGTQFGMLLTYMHEQGHASHLLADLEGFYRSAKKQFDSDEDFSNRSREAVVNLQSGKAFESEHWKTFIETSMSHCEEIYEKLRVGLNSSHVRGESSYNAALPEVINIFKESNLLEESEGAQCIFFEGQKSPLIVQKADGGFLYATTDLAAIRYRVNELEANRILYFVDSRQSLHFRQIFAAIELADLNPKGASLEHMAFGTMLNEEGKPFKTREGGLIKLKPLIEEAIRRATRTALEKNPEMSKHKAQEIGKLLFTPAIPAHYAIDVALDELIEETVVGRLQRYANSAKFLRDGFKELNLEYLIPEGWRSNCLTGLKLPKGVSYEKLHRKLKANGFVIYAGQGNLSEKIFRIANMGDIKKEEFDRFLKILGTIC